MFFQWLTFLYCGTTNVPSWVVFFTLYLNCPYMKTVSDLKCRLRFKGDLLWKKRFYEVFEHLALMCKINQPVMVKIHPLIFYNLKKS